MENHQIVKAFIASAKEFSTLKTDTTSNSLQRYLQILSATNDLSIFDTGSCEASEFYVSLHELMCGLDAQSEMMWCAVSVLQEAARNQNTRNSLIHIYKFTPILTSLLNTQLIPEKRYRVLKLLEELTYGVKITWQEGHLSSLVKHLVKCVEDSELISVALGVLVNICYKNIPAVYTLMQSVDTKLLIKSILRSQGDKVNVRVQLCKLMMILDHLSEDIPDSEIVMFVKVTYTMMEQALRSNNVHLLQHIVDFFKDMKHNARARRAVASYSGYYTNTEALITLLSEENDEKKGECLSLFMEFLQFLIIMEVTDLYNLYPSIVKLALRWVQIKGVSIKALDLLSTVTMQCRIKDSNLEVFHAVMRLLEEHLQILLLMLETGSNCETLVSNELHIALTSLLHLLQELTYNSTLCSQIDATVKKETIQKLFYPLLSTEKLNNNNLYEQPAAALYVQALCFLSELTLKNVEWQPLYKDLLTQKQTLRALAVALYSNTGNVKEQVLFLTGTHHFPKDSLAGLAECMEDLSQLLVLAPSNNVNQIIPSVSTVTPYEGLPIFTPTQKEAINNCISKLEDQYTRNQVVDKSTSAVIELYQYKMSAMNHAERALQTSLEAATAYSTHLTQRVAQISAELNRLHQLLYTNQHILEGGRLELNKVKKQLHETESAANISHNKYNQLKLDMQSKTRIITELSQSTEELKKRTEVLEQLCKESEDLVTSLQNQVKNQDSVNESLKTELGEKTKAYITLEEKLSKREQTLMEKEAEIEKRKLTNQALEREVSNQRALIKGLERSSNDKDKELSEAKKKLKELQKIRDAIYEISAGKIKMDPQS